MCQPIIYIYLSERAYLPVHFPYEHLPNTIQHHNTLAKLKLDILSAT